MKSSRSRLLLLGGVVLTLGACAVVPQGPSVMVLPGTGKNFDQFRMDDFNCRQYANGQVGGGSYENAANDSALRSAAVGTLIGAAAGAAIGGTSRGAGIGAGTGLLMGAASGTGTGQVSGRYAQQRYDNAYVQCMYSYGHRVPVRGQFPPGQSGYAPEPMYAPTPSYLQQPPPAAPQPGYPPPPPVGAPAPLR